MEIDAHYVVSAAGGAMPTFEPVPMPMRIPAIVVINWRHTPRFRILSAMLYAILQLPTLVLREFISQLNVNQTAHTAP
ncbi:MULTISPECIES: hypothetical protein, partial [Caballeronia]|uniref:hypothetical protein n=1 Tax=Caballeronia TaxID=1827195 RepID=UPI001F382A47